MAKKKVKVGLQGKSPEQKADLADRVGANSTGKASLPSVQPLLAGLATKSAAVRAKLLKVSNKKQELTTAVSELHTAELDIDDALNKVGSKVDDDADGNETTILDSGYGVAAAPSPAGAIQLLARCLQLIAGLVKPGAS